jgi:predicted GH43/DUF377 family glycosyl hydrolase
MDAPARVPEVPADLLTRSDLILKPDPSRTVIRPFAPDDPEGYIDKAHPRAQRITDRILALDEEMVHRMLGTLLSALGDRHRNLEDLLLRRFDEVDGAMIEKCTATREQRMVIGSYFSAEYSFEAAALFNPSIVPHPRGAVTEDGRARFLMSLRGIGEGHVSSVTFRTGTWSAEQGFAIDQPSRFAVPPQIESSQGDGDDMTICLRCEESEDVSETVIFPTTPSQRQGVEDMRLVSFLDDEGETQIYGTYTAFDGRTARSELMHGSDFRSFSLRPLKGKFSGSKGMALFPRKIDGRYMMLARQDNENIWLLHSDDLYRWDEGDKLLSPAFPWEFVQIGNCGSPIEIDEGWLVLTHGVGMARNYCMGACLLDKTDPSKVLGRAHLPILKPDEKDRDGYVPNVVYGCGGMVHDRTLLLPYGVADNYATFASVALDDLLSVIA